MALVRNVGSVDKIIRLVAGVLLAAWGLLAAGLRSTIGILALFKIFGISSFRNPG